MADFTVVLEPTLRPICDPASCEHPLENRISVTARIEATDAKRDRMALDAIFCLCCGRELVGDLQWGVAFNRAWGEVGWNARIGGRLWDLLLLRGHDGHLGWPAEAERELNNGNRFAEVGQMTWRDAPAPVV